MADEMTNNNGADPTRLYQDAVQAQQAERLNNISRRQGEFESETRASLRQIETSIGSLANETRTALAGLSGNLADRSRPQWQALGVTLTFAALLGGLAYMPIREATSDLKTAVATLATNTVSRQEMDWRASRGTEDRDRTTTAIVDLRESSVSRNEWAERNRARDQELADLSRRIEEVRATLGSQYTTRDVLLELQAEVKDLRSRRASRMP